MRARTNSACRRRVASTKTTSERICEHTGGGSDGSCGGSGTARRAPDNWQLTWSDEFGGSVLDASKWTVSDNFTHTSNYMWAPGTSELQIYIKDAVAINVKNDELCIEFDEFVVKMMNFISKMMM